MTPRSITAALLGLALLGGIHAQAQIRKNEAFTKNALVPNDDGSTDLVELGWTLNFFGRYRSHAYVNNNGNITFDAPMPEYTPFGLTGVRREIIAPFFADVDTRNIASKLVTFGTDKINGRKAFGVNWVDVGYYAIHADKLNSFQLVLIERPDTGEGNFDIEFNYERIAWETGDASGGLNGYGGVSASVGWSNGSGVAGTSFELAGSLIPGSFLDGGPNSLVNGRTPGVLSGGNSPSGNTSTAGRWMFRARDGQLIPPLSIVSGCPVPNATAGRLYAYKFEAAGAKPPYRWTLQNDPNSSVPSLTLNTGGILSGIPPAPGEYGFTLRAAATDEDGELSITKRCSIIVDPPSVFISTNPSLPTANTNTRYETRLRAEGGQGPFEFQLFQSSEVPGLTLSPDGVLSGTPRLAATYPFQVIAMSKGADRAVPAIKRFTLNVRASELSFNAGCPLPNGTGGVPFSHEFSAQGGFPPYRWSVTGNLPPGLAFTSEGRLTGIPTVPHWWPFTVKVQDERGNSASSDCGVSILFPEVRVSSACPLPPANAGAPYLQRLQASGGAEPYNWSVSGSLPNGLKLSSDGLLTGTPLSAGPSQFRVQVTDGAGLAGSSNCSVIVNRGEYGVATCPLPDAFSGEPYSVPLSASGGLEPYIWALVAPLPAGLRLSPDGFLQGVVQNAGVYNIITSVADRSGRVAARACELRVRPKALRLVNACDLAQATIGTAYSGKLTAAGGVEPYAFRAVTPLPEGLRLTADGLLAGTPQRAGSVTVTFEANDRSGSTVLDTCRITVGIPGPPDVRITGMPAVLAPASAGPKLTVELSQSYPLALETDLTLDVVPATQTGNAILDKIDPAVVLSNGQKTLSLRFEPGVRRQEVQISLTGTVASTLTIALSKLRLPGTTVEFPKQAVAATGYIDRLAPAVTNVCYAPTDDGFDVNITGYTTTRELQRADLTFGSNRYTVSLTRSSQEYFTAEDSIRTGGAFQIRAPYRLRQGNARGLGDGSVTIGNKVGNSPSAPIRRCQ